MRKTVKLAAEKSANWCSSWSTGPYRFRTQKHQYFTSGSLRYRSLSNWCIKRFLQAEGLSMQHVKPHGALYNMAAKNKALSEAIAKAVYNVNPELILFGLSGSELIQAGNRIGLKTANEVFADRTYQLDGSLTPRTEPNALIENDDEAVSQVITMVKEGKVKSQQGKDVELQADTICIHGDGAHALEFARHVNRSLQASEVVVKAISQ